MRAGGLKTNTHKKTKGVVSCPRGRIVLSQQSRSSYLLMRNSKTAFPWTMFNVSSEYTFAKLLEDVELHLGSNLLLLPVHCLQLRTVCLHKE